VNSRADPGLVDARGTMLARVIRFNLIAVALALGLVGALLLWLATAILLWRGGENIGVHLGLLGVFLPGYEVTWAGAWIGLFWGFVAGALSGLVVYGAYARRLRRGAVDQLLERPRSEGLRPPVMLLSGGALGVGLGALGALQLILSTNWLVLRGTAANSTNAALLGQYLPGYTVSFTGSLIGAAQVFVLAVVASMAVATIYNIIARRRAGS
jgi:hypothetical protein